jgi:hypothetical protein
LAKINKEKRKEEYINLFFFASVFGYNSRVVLAVQGICLQHKVLDSWIPFSSKIKSKEKNGFIMGIFRWLSKALLLNFIHGFIQDKVLIIILVN